jgi:DNA-directed RNA polymerase subunit K/omega
LRIFLKNDKINKKVERNLKYLLMKVSTVVGTKLTKYEETRIIGVRAHQIACGAVPNVNCTSLDPLAVAREELKHCKIPFVLTRSYPNGDKKRIVLHNIDLSKPPPKNTQYSPPQYSADVMSSPRYSPARDIGVYSPSSPVYSPVRDTTTTVPYSPSSPAYSPTRAANVAYSPSSPVYSPTRDATVPYSPSSPAYSPTLYATVPYSPSSPAYSPSSPATYNKEDENVETTGDRRPSARKKLKL